MLIRDEYILHGKGEGESESIGAPFFLARYDCHVVALSAIQHGAVNATLCLDIPRVGGVGVNPVIQDQWFTETPQADRRNLVAGDKLSLSAEVEGVLGTQIQLVVQLEIEPGHVSE